MAMPGGKQQSRELWTNKHFLLGKSAIELPPRKGPVVSFEQSTQFIFGDQTFFLSFGDSIAQVLSMISALLGEQLEALHNKANQMPEEPKAVREWSAFHSFCPAVSAKEAPKAPVPKPLGFQVV